MLRLLVLRHAKAAPHDEKHDKQRPLIARGRDDASRMGHAMQAKSYLPALVLCSPAARTLQTWEAVAAEIRAEPAVDLLEDLYDASEKAILESVHGVRNAAHVVLYVGHNPGLERFARRMVREPQDAEERRRANSLAHEFPTAALAVIDFDARAWKDIAPHSGILADFVTPADLGKREA